MMLENPFDNEEYAKNQREKFDAILKKAENPDGKLTEEDKLILRMLAECGNLKLHCPLCGQKSSSWVELSIFGVKDFTVCFNCGYDDEIMRSFRLREESCYDCVYGFPSVMDLGELNCEKYPEMDHVHGDQGHNCHEFRLMTQAERQEKEKALVKLEKELDEALQKAHEQI